MNPCVYILTNETASVLYTGVTSDLEKRIGEHRNDVGSIFTRQYSLHKVVIVEYHPTMMLAIAREKAD